MQNSNIKGIHNNRNRCANLKRILDTRFHGDKHAMIQALAPLRIGLTTIGQWTTPDLNWTRRLTEPTARDIEWQLGLTPGALDAPADTSPHAPERLIELAHQALAEGAASSVRTGEYEPTDWEWALLVLGAHRSSGDNATECWKKLILLAVEAIGDAACDAQEGGTYKPAEWAHLVITTQAEQHRITAGEPEDANASPAPDDKAIQADELTSIARELMGVIQEYRDMPCDSLEQRMFATVDRYQSRIPEQSSPDTTNTADDDAWLANAETIDSPSRRGYRAFDSHDQAYSLQESSAASDDYLWMGLDHADPVISVDDARMLGLPTTKQHGMMPFQIPREVILATRMHLSRDQVKELLPTLQYFATTGRLPMKDDKKESS